MRPLAIAVVLFACTREPPRGMPAPRAAVSAAPTEPTGAPAVPAMPRDEPAALTGAPAVPLEPRMASAPPAEPRAAAVDPRIATRQAAHDALAEHCGACHERHRPTAKPAALAVFDLDQPDWPSRFDEHRSQSALRRLAGKPAAARDAFRAFRDAEVAAR